jgi:hypothetical protein
LGEENLDQEEDVNLTVHRGDRITFFGIFVDDSDGFDFFGADELSDRLQLFIK